MLGKGGWEHTAELSGNYMSMYTKYCVGITTERTKP